METSRKGGPDASATGSADIERRILSVMRRGMRLSRVAWIAPAPQGPRSNGSPQPAMSLRFLEGSLPENSTAEGLPVPNLGAAAPVLTSGKPLLLNPDREMPVCVPYASSPVRIRGAMAAPVGGGVVWADRDRGPILDDEFAVFRDLCSVLEEGRGLQETVSMRDERAEYLSRVLEGIQAILTSTSEQECMAALVESAAHLTRTTAGAVTLFGVPTVGTGTWGAGDWTQPLEATVVAAVGNGTRDWLGRAFDPSQGLVGLAMRHGAAVPSSRTFASNMAQVLGPDIRLPLREGDSIVVHPLGNEADPVGALVLTGGDYDPAVAMYGIRSLCDAATLLVQRFRLQQRISRDAMMDGLTGLFNRKAFLQNVGGTFSFCRRHGQDLSLLMLDADHFKQVNDRYGHLAGDRALRFIADVIRRGLRESDIAGRYGGEEFAIALPHTAGEGAFRVAERIRRLCSASPVLIGHHKVRLTVSIGVSTMDRSTESLESLIAAADEALYAAKRAGRNRVMIAGDLQ